MQGEPSSTATIKNTIPIEAPPSIHDGRSLQTLTHLFTKKAIKDNTVAQMKELQELKKEHAKVRELQKLQQLLTIPGDEGDLALSEEMLSIMEKAEKCGTVIPKYGDSITKDQRVDLIDRLRVTIDNLSQDNDILLQKVSRMTNLMHEMLAVARNLERTLHEIMMKVSKRG